MSHTPSSSRAASTRHIALRAAMAVTGLVATGCYDSSQHQGDSGPQVDAAVALDSPCSFSSPPTNQAACEGCGFGWDATSATCFAAVPGPFVPPSLA